MQKNNTPDAGISIKNAASSSRSMASLVWVIFLGFLSMGLPLAVLPLHVADTLLFSPFIVGLVIGTQSLVTLVSRMYAGRLADTRGAKKIAIQGLIVSALSGVAYYASSLIPHPSTALIILIFGRVLLGLGESMLMTGGMSWGIGLLGKEQSAQVISWMGLAMYGALAFGAPIGMIIFQQMGFATLTWIIVTVPVLGLLLATRLTATPIIPPTVQGLMSVRDIMGKIWLPGLGMALSAVSFALIASFISLYYEHHNWSGASLSLMVFGIAYMMMRIFFINTLKKFGPNQVLMVVLPLEILGQALLWLAPSPSIALMGAALTGIGYSLVMPSFAAEVVRKVSDHSRGAALGAYTAFFDLALGLTGPVAGLLITRAGISYSSIFILGIVATFLAVLVAYRLHKHAQNNIA